MQTNVVRHTITKNQINNLPEKDKQLLVVSLQLATIGAELGNSSLVRLGWRKAAPFLGVPDDIDLMKDAYETPEGDLVIEMFASREEDKSQC